MSAEGQPICEEEIERAFEIIEGRLGLIPINKCGWAEKHNGVFRKKTLSDYKALFEFVNNFELADNLASLRMCLDYITTLYKLHRPYLVFDKHHKLLIFQMLGSLYEGLLVDLYERIMIKHSKKSVERIVMSEKITRRQLTLGVVIEIFHKADVISQKRYVYLKEVSSLRNSIHPKTYSKSSLLVDNFNLMWHTRLLDSFIPVVSRICPVL